MLRQLATGAIITALQLLPPLGPDAHPVLHVLSLIERDPLLIKRVGSGPYASTKQSTLEKLGRFVFRDNVGGGWGVCHPSLETLGTKSRYARDTLVDAIRALEERDELVVKVRRVRKLDRAGGPNGRWENRTNVYLIKLREDALPIDVVRQVAEALRNEPRKIVTALRMLSDAAALDGPLSPEQVKVLLERHGGRLLRRSATDSTVAAESGSAAEDDALPDSSAEVHSPDADAPEDESAAHDTDASRAASEPSESSPSTRANARAATRAALNDFATFEAIWIPARTAVHKTRGPGGDLPLKDREKLGRELRSLTRQACEEARKKGLLGELAEQQVFAEICAEVSQLWLAHPGSARPGEEPFLRKRKHALPLLLGDLDALGPDVVQAWLKRCKRERRPSETAAAAAAPAAPPPPGWHRGSSAAVFAEIDAGEKISMDPHAPRRRPGAKPAREPAPRLGTSAPELGPHKGHGPPPAPQGPP